MRSRLAVLLLGMLALHGCRDDGGDGASGAPDGDLLVFAAASLTDAFGELGRAFEDEHPEVDVVLNLAGSQRLAAQILEGAPAHVLASADRVQADRVVATGFTTGEPTVFATTSLTIAVAPGNPHGVTGPWDLARDELTVVLAADAVPLGRYTATMLQRAGVTAAPASRELDARAVLARVALGEADAGVVYASDVHGRDDVEAVALAADTDVTASYVAVRMDTPLPAAEDFVAFLLGDAGRAVLRDAGFGVP